jgi:putative hydrolase of the HAD superfamily
LDDTLYPQETFKRSGFKVVARWVAEHFDFDASRVMGELDDIMLQRGASYPYIFNDLADRLKVDKRSVPRMVQVFIDHEPRISCYPGVLEMLTRLKKRFRLGLLTDGRLTVQQRKIRALGLEADLDEILCSNRMGLEKPANELYKWFEKKFEMMGQNLMYVGDNPRKDFYGANLRNWMTVCVLTGENQSINCESAFKSRNSISSIINLEKLLQTFI